MVRVGTPWRCLVVLFHDGVEHVLVGELSGDRNTVDFRQDTGKEPVAGLMKWEAGSLCGTAAGEVAAEGHLAETAGRRIVHHELNFTAARVAPLC